MKEEALTTGSEINGYIQGRGHTFVKSQVRYGSNYLRMGVAGKKNIFCYSLKQ